MLSAVVIASDSCGLSKTVGSTNLRQRNADKLSDVCLFFFLITFGNDFCLDTTRTFITTNPQKIWGLAFGLLGICLGPCQNAQHISTIVCCLCSGTLFHPLGICQIYDSAAWHSAGIFPAHPPPFTCGKYVHIKLYNRFDSGVNYALGRTSITWRHLSTCQLAVINTTLCSIHLSTEVW